MEFFLETDHLRVAITETRLDAIRAPACKQLLAESVQGRPLRVLVDARLVQFIDSSGLGVLVFLLKQMGDGGRIAVAAPSPAVRRLFELTKLDSVFQLWGSLEEAAIALRA
jgi:anti-sigma B factor antagonist